MYNIVQQIEQLNVVGVTSMEDTNLCNIHHVKLEDKKASTFLGYPAQEVFDVDNMFPYHLSWNLTDILFIIFIFYV